MEGRTAEKKRWIVTYGGFEIYEGNDEDKAYEAYIEAGPYGRIREETE